MINYGYINLSVSVLKCSFYENELKLFISVQLRYLMILFCVCLPALLFSPLTTFLFHWLSFFFSSLVLTHYQPTEKSHTFNQGHCLDT